MGGVYVIYSLVIKEAFRRSVNTNSISIIRFVWLNQPLNYNLASEEVYAFSNI